MVPGDPFHSDPARIDEYVDLILRGQAPHLRAWVREADRTIRANNEVYGIKADDQEDQPWLSRAWQSFRRFFTGS